DSIVPSVIVRGQLHSLPSAVSTSHGSSVPGTVYERCAESSEDVFGLIPWEIAVARVNALNVEPAWRLAATGKLNCWLLLYGTEPSIASTSPVRGSSAVIAAAGASVQLMVEISA